MAAMLLSTRFILLTNSNEDVAAFKISVPYPFQWGDPTFNAGECFAMMAAAFVALVESTGSFIAVSRYASATPAPHSILSRGIGWQSLRTALLVVFYGSTVLSVFASVGLVLLGRELSSKEK